MNHNNITFVFDIDKSMSSKAATSRSHSETWLRFVLYWVLTFLSCFQSTAYAAGPINHAYFTDMLLKQYPKYNEMEAHAFRLGSLFPDIRYLGTVTRESTHYDQMTLQEVLEEPSPFIAGVKFHSYIDLERERFVEENHIYALLHGCQGPNHTLLKLLEDEIVYDLKDWQEWSEITIDVFQNELDWGVDLNTVQKWHRLLFLSFQYRPSTIIYLLSLAKKGAPPISKDDISNWNTIFIHLANSDPIQKYVKDLLYYFESKIIISKKNLD